MNIPTEVFNIKNDIAIQFKVDNKGNAVDTVSQKTRVKEQGFPFELFASGQLSKKCIEESHSFTIPSDVCKGSIKTSIKLYLSPLSNLTGKQIK